MDKETKQEQRKLIDKQLEEAMFSTATLTSSSECTGLMYRPARNEYERKSYEEIYHYLPPNSVDKS